MRKAACIDLRNFVTNSWDIARERVPLFLLSDFLAKTKLSLIIYFIYKLSHISCRLR